MLNEIKQNAESYNQTYVVLYRLNYSLSPKIYRFSVILDSLMNTKYVVIQSLISRLFWNYSFTTLPGLPLEGCLMSSLPIQPTLSPRQVSRVRCFIIFPISPDLPFINGPLFLTSYFIKDILIKLSRLPVHGSLANIPGHDNRLRPSREEGFARVGRPSGGHQADVIRTDSGRQEVARYQGRD